MKIGQWFCALLFTYSFVFSINSFAQVNEPKLSFVQNKENRNRITIGLGHTQVGKGKIGNDKKWLALASWSLNYDYKISNKWALGLQNDVILEAFVIEDVEGKAIDRNYPVSVVPVGIYKVNQHWFFVAGLGREFANNHHLNLTRLGVEYGYHIKNSWEIGVALVWDNKWNYYNSWGLTLTSSRLW